MKQTYPVPGLKLFFAIVYGGLLGINAGNLDFAAARSMVAGAQVFMLNAWLGYNVLYLLPALMLTWLVGRLWRWGGNDAAAVRAVTMTAVLTGALTTLFFYINTQLHALYGMFVNGFVLNLVFTPGGLESLGGSTASNIGFALIGLGVLLGHVLLFAICRWLALRTPQLTLPNWRWTPLLIALVLVSTLGDKVAYAYSNALGKSDMLVLTQGVPYYTALTARHFFRKLGFHISPQETPVTFKGKLHYPLSPIEAHRPSKPYNIVWLVSESWRADTLNDEIMPSTMRFARQAQNFRLHYSGGNGTRIGVFTMMTGVPGSYWPVFLQTHRSAPLIDVLQRQQYQMALYTSARFSYPEFDQTIFSQVPKSQLHWIDGPGAGWEKDRQNVSDMLQFIDRRDPNQPFFTFMFFESPHARYYFPPESVIRTPYRDDINYATLDRGELRDDIGLIKNRYLNAVHHLDSQFARVIDYLKAHDLLETTIVVMVGDHGEEFMEHGFWGHNSTFDDPQTRTPLVLWVPGRAPAEYHKLTSHLDLPATLMPLLGVRNPVSDYSVGLDLLGNQQHEHVILSDWSSVGYVDRSVKIRLPINAQGFASKKITGPHDQMLTSDQAATLFRAEQQHLVEMMKDLGRYTLKAAK